MAQQFRVLLFTKTAGFHHESIHEGVAGVRKLAERHTFRVDWQENASVFNDKALENYQAVIFLNTTGDILNEEQQAAFEKFIRAGKGFVGVHSATDTEYEWPWYTKMVGMMFKIHPQQQTAYLNVEDSNFPGMERFPKRLLWTDEWYEFSPVAFAGLCPGGRREINLPPAVQLAGSAGDGSADGSQARIAGSAI
jgi:type 1 glutamine amidotransferase